MTILLIAAFIMMRTELVYAHCTRAKSINPFAVRSGVIRYLLLIADIRKWTFRQFFAALVTK